MPGETLPPVVAVLQGDISDLVSKVAAAKAEVESMDDVEGTATIGVDSTVGEQVAKATAEVEAFGELRSDATIGVHGAPMAGITSGVLAGLLGGGAAGAAGGDGGGGGGGLLSTLGWGSGAFGIFAGFGSVLSLMGLGAEHAAATIVGLAGSLGGALVGAAALAGGALSIFAVGMVTDMAGIGQAAGDIKTTYTALSTYQTMQQALTKQIPQTAAAQTALNAALAGFAPAARSAVLAAALTANQFHWLYNQATGTAEAIGANIINQAMQVGEVFLPILGKFATINMGIIQSGIQPLFRFLGTTGVTVLTNLERIFTSRLPTAVAASTQGVELLVKAMNFLANQTTGGFMASILKFLTYLNTPAGFTKFEGFLTTTISMFRKWWDLLKQVAITIYDVFKPSKGLGTSIVTTLTSMLKSLDKWITSSSGKKELHSIFAVHKTEVIELLKFLGTLLSVGGQLGLKVIPPFVTLANVLLRVSNRLLHIPGVGTLIAWGAAASILVSRLKLVQLAAALMKIPGAVVTSWKFMSLLPTRIGLVTLRLKEMTKAALTQVGAAAKTSAAWVTSAAKTSAAWVASTAKIGAAWVVAKAKMIGTAVWSAMATSVGLVGDAFVALKGGVLGAAAAFAIEKVQAALAWVATLGPLALIVGAIVLVIAAIVLLVTHWKQVSTVVGKVLGNIGNWIKSLPGDIWNWIKTIPGDFGKIWNTVLGDVEKLIGNIVGWFEKLPGEIAKAVGKISIGGISIGGIESLIGGHAAMGGPVLAGTPYIVGEQGQELFVPTQNGTIIPNNQLGASRPISVTFDTTVNGSGLNESQMSAAIANAWSQISGRLQQQLLASGY